ncbi:hypothetical protein BEH94_00560 [Candidatus Altiarchaeales archaeon WOR_SM1_SCG]|nr:hypothetical protein BEH94_00560 [Candidatus Altiarchaeales archaeon WOR_SM1_SCG]
MTRNITSLSKQEFTLLSTLSAEGKNIFTIDDASKVIKKDRNEIRSILHKLSKKSGIERIERGKYLIIPLEAGTKRRWSDDPFVIASGLVTPYTIAYWSALSYWNLTEQIPQTIFVASTHRKFTGQKRIVNIPYRFITISPKKFFGIKIIWINDKKVNITDPEKTVVDCLDRPQYCGGITEAAKGIWNGIEDKKIDLNKITEYAVKINNKAVFKRMGYLCEILGIETPHHNTWRDNISNGYSLLDPILPDKGSYIRKWRLRLNIDKYNLTEWREH